MASDLVMVGPTARNEFVTQGATTAIEIPFDDIGVTVEVAREASRNLAASPLFQIVGSHLLALRADADLASSSAAAGEIGAATAQLVRALIVSAAVDENCARLCAHRCIASPGLRLCPPTPDRQGTYAGHHCPGPQYFSEVSVQTVRCSRREAGRMDHCGATRRSSTRTHFAFPQQQDHRFDQPTMGVQGSQPLQQQIQECLRHIAKGTATTLTASVPGSDLMTQWLGTGRRPLVLAQTRSVQAQTIVCWHFGR